MTGQEFERKFCQLLFDAGYWVLNIPRNATGSQPFDVLAIKKQNGRDYVLAVDCKVCESRRFPLDRIEDNQWSAFELLKRRTNAKAGIAVFSGNRIYFYSYGELLFAKNEGYASIGFSTDHLFGYGVKADDFVC